jgi:hypothetical protein
VVTVEGLSTEEALTPLQAAFRKHHALQSGCGRPPKAATSKLAGGRSVELSGSCEPVGKVISAPSRVGRCQCRGGSDPKGPSRNKRVIWRMMIW